jgi:hypothetical protein
MKKYQVNIVQYCTAVEKRYAYFDVVAADEADARKLIDLKFEEGEVEFQDTKITSSGDSAEWFFKEVPLDAPTQDDVTINVIDHLPSGGTGQDEGGV